MLTTGSCDRHGAAWEKLEIAENLMDSKPDSALAVLEGIPASKVKGKEISARYALLKSIALDKNCIDTTTFDILQPAIDYYIAPVTPSPPCSLNMTRISIPSRECLDIQT